MDCCRRALIWHASFAPRLRRLPLQLWRGVLVHFGSTPWFRGGPSLKRTGAILATACALIFPRASAAENANGSVSRFYHGKSLTLTVGSAPGGSYDLYGRTLASFLPKHMPGNPSIIVQNMPGAGSIVAAQRLANTAPRDGTEIGEVYRGAIIMPLLGRASGYDPTQFGWLGSPTSETALCLFWAQSRTKTFQQALQHQVIMGSTSTGADVTGLLSPLVKLLGAKFKIVNGYEGGAALDLAMARGEIEGRCGVSWSALLAAHSDWIRNKKVNIVLQLGYKPRANLPDVPMAQDFARSAEDRKILNLLLSPQVTAYPFFAPPGVPKERVEALRAAFSDTMKDPGFIDTATQRGLELSPVTGEQVEALIHKIYATSPTLATKASAVLQ